MITKMTMNSLPRKFRFPSLKMYRLLNMNNALKDSLLQLSFQHVCRGTIFHRSEVHHLEHPITAKYTYIALP